MKICLTTSRKNAPSTYLNNQLLQNLEAFELNDHIETDADIQLFMGYDPLIDEARKVNSDTPVGIIDPRPGAEEDLKKADFFLANGVEMVNYFAGANPVHFIYPIYPPIGPGSVKSGSTDKSKLVIGYHGNKTHLELMEPTVCSAMERLAEDYEIELRLVYNVSSLGEWKWKPQSRSIFVKHLQWTEQAYVEHLTGVNVGIVPNSIPFNPELSEFDRHLQESNLAHDSDLFQRYKPTSNMGRILVFAQLGVPVIADMYPSAAEIIQHGKNGLLATNSESWFNSFSWLAQNMSSGQEMGKELKKTFEKRYHWQVKNQELYSFFELMIKKQTSKNLKFTSKFKRIFK